MTAERQRSSNDQHKWLTGFWCIWSVQRHVAYYCEVCHAKTQRQFTIAWIFPVPQKNKSAITCSISHRICTRSDYAFSCFRVVALGILSWFVSVYNIEYAHNFLVLCFLVVILAVICWLAREAVRQLKIFRTVFRIDSSIPNLKKSATEIQWRFSLNEGNFNNKRGADPHS